MAKKKRKEQEIYARPSLTDKEWDLIYADMRKLHLTLPKTPQGWLIFAELENYPPQIIISVAKPSTDNRRSEKYHGIHGTPIVAELKDEEKEEIAEWIGLIADRRKNLSVKLNFSVSTEANLVYVIRPRLYYSYLKVREKQAEYVVPDRKTPQGLEIWTDGTCDGGSRGTGGYGAVILDENGKMAEFSGGYKNTTSNRMELMAVIVGLEGLHEPTKVTVFSDSQLIVKTMTEGWKRKRNKDLWTKLDALCTRHTVRFVWVKGHTGSSWNEYCDALSSIASRRTDLLDDPVFVAQSKNHPTEQGTPLTLRAT